jgi:hypothetical protein
MPCGCGQVVYVFTTEVYPSSCRTSGLCTAGAMSRLAGIATTYISMDLSTPVWYASARALLTCMCVCPHGSVLLLLSSLLLYAIGCGFAIVAVLSLNIETNGQGLAEVSAAAAEDEDDIGGH